MIGKIARSKIIAGSAAMLFCTFGIATSAANASVAQPGPAESLSLQAQVDAHLKNSVGGKQTGLNTISYENGTVVVTLPLPGEQQARAVGEAISPLGTANCASLWACLWDGTNFNGARLALTNCGTYTLSAYGFANITSSIHNNQSSGTQTYILNSSSQILNANLAPSRVNDVGVGDANRAVFWHVC